MSSSSIFSADRVADRMPVSVLTGCLGSGKTTLLNKLLQRPELADTAVIINEFGDVGLDHLLVQAMDGEVAVLASGCVCCTLRSDFETTLRDLLARRDRGEIPPFRRVVLETTGLADPAPILQTVIANPLLSHFCRLDGVATTVDVAHIERQLEQTEARKQVALADRLLLTKTDLAAPDDVEAVRRLLRLLNPAAPMETVVQGAGDPGLVFGLEGTSPEAKLELMRRWAEVITQDNHAHDDHGDDEHDHDEHDHAHHHHGIRSLSLTADEPLDWLMVQEWLADLRRRHGDRLLRVKGILNLIGETEPVVIHGVHHLFHEPVRLAYWPERPARSRVVLIAEGLDFRSIAQDFAQIGGR